MQAKTTGFKRFSQPGSDIRQPAACSCKTPLDPRSSPYLQAPLPVPRTPIHRRGWHQWFPSRTTSSSLQLSAVLRSAWTRRVFDLAFFFFIYLRKKKKRSQQILGEKKASKGKILNENKRLCNSTESEHISHKGMLIFTCHKKILSPKHNRRSYVLTREKKIKYWRCVKGPSPGWRTASAGRRKGLCRTEQLIALGNQELRR